MIEFGWEKGRTRQGSSLFRRDTAYAHLCSGPRSQRRLLVRAPSRHRSGGGRHQISQLFHALQNRILNIHYGVDDHILRVASDLFDPSDVDVLHHVAGSWVDGHWSPWAIPLHALRSIDESRTQATPSTASSKIWWSGRRPTPARALCIGLSMS